MSDKCAICEDTDDDLYDCEECGEYVCYGCMCEGPESEDICIDCEGMEQ